MILFDSDSFAGMESRPEFRGAFCSRDGGANGLHPIDYSALAVAEIVEHHRVVICPHQLDAGVRADIARAAVMRINLSLIRSLRCRPSLRPAQLNQCIETSRLIVIIQTASIRHMVESGELHESLI